MARRSRESVTRTGGRAATSGVIPGRFGLSVGKPNLPAPTDWSWTPLCELARLETGHTPSRKHPEYWGGDIPWIGIGDATANHGRTITTTEENTNELGIANSSARVLPTGTVCLSRTASVGYVVVMGRAMATSQDFVNWVCTERIDNRFLKYVLLAEHNSMLRFASGTTHQTIYFPEAKAFHLCLPPPREQKAIADMLGALDDKIELHRRINKSLEEIIRVIFRSWFLEFTPLRAKAEGRPAELPETIAGLFTDRLTTTALGEIPAAWSVGKLGDVAEHPRRGARPEEIEPATPYIALEHMPRGCIALSEWIAADGVKSNKFRFKRGEILFGKLRPYFHKVGIAPLDGVCSTDIVVVAAKSAKWFGFVLGHVSSTKFVEYASAASTGTKMPRTNWADMARYAIVIPPESIAEAFTDHVRPISERIIASVHESRTLTTLRDTLLPKLVSGELRTSEAARLVEEVA